MKPLKGHKVKILFRNGAVESGVVEAWTDKEAILRSNESNNILIIQNITQDVMAIKVILEDDIKNNINSIPENKNINLIQNEHREMSQEDKKEYIPDINLRAKKLIELRNEKALLEKEQVKKTLRANNGIKDIQYDLPNSLLFAKNTGINNNPGKKS